MGALTPLLRLVVAETCRAMRRAQTSRVLVVGALGLVLFAVVEHRASGPGAASGIADALVGLRSAAPLIALVLAALYVGKWWTSGTAQLVMTWTPHRWQLAAAETMATAAVVTIVITTLWWCAVGLLDPRSLLDWRAALTTPLVVAVPIAAVLGSSVAMLCRSAAGAIVLTVGTYAFGEPLVRAAVEPAVGPAVGWLLPVTALMEMVGTLPAAPTGATAPAWAVAAAWCVAAVIAVQLAVTRRDLA